MTGKLKAAGFVLALFAGGFAQACQTCMDKGVIESREECRLCKTTGKVFPPKCVCPACGGRGVMLDGYGNIYRGNQGTRQCKMCRSTGTIQPDKVPCEQCAGQGVFVSKIVCPSCKGASAGAAAGAGTATDSQGNAEIRLPAAQPAPIVQTTQVETCTVCGPDGKIRQAVTCDMCEGGFNHKKTTAGGKEMFVCRNCNKACESRFKPCACQKPDCPSCIGKRGPADAKPCEVCGGDKIITPLEKSRMK